MLILCSPLKQIIFIIPNNLVAVRIVPTTQKLANKNVQIICQQLVSLLLKWAASSRLSGELGVGIRISTKSRAPVAAQVCIQDNRRMGCRKA